MYPSLATLHAHFTCLGVFVPSSNLNYIIAKNLNAAKNWWTNVLNSALTLASIPTMNFNSVDVSIPIVSPEFIDQCIRENAIVDLKSHLLRSKDTNLVNHVKEISTDYAFENKMPSATLSNEDFNPNSTIESNYVDAEISNSFYFNFTFLLSSSINKENNDRAEAVQNTIAANGGLCYLTPNVKWDVLICTDTSEAVKCLTAKKWPVELYIIIFVQI